MSLGGLVASRGSRLSPSRGSLAYNLNVLPQPRSWDLSSGADSPFSLNSSSLAIIVDSQYASYRDVDGMSLIPPTLYEFAETFASDIASTFGTSPSLSNSSDAPTSGIFFTIIPNTSQLVDGNYTSEGYAISSDGDVIRIEGAGARGAWWATKTILQAAILNSGVFPAGNVTDAPDYGIRGHMLDASRHWYSAPYLTELCNYLSFFKMNEFHFHLSDNVDPYATDEWRSYYARFRLWTDNVAFAGLAHQNESYDFDTFSALQSDCASRGVTLIPEIEAPGHAMPLSQWQDSTTGKQIYIDADPTLLNLSIPGVTELVESIWTEFLPWFQTKEVSIGADEYPSDLADSYITFVNDLNGLISESGKHIRAWGTDEPSNTTSIDKNVTIQHWALYATDPYALIEEGYPVINSQDWIFYEVLKHSEYYPPAANLTRYFNFGDPSVPGLVWNTSLMNYTDPSYNPSPSTPLLRGSIAPVWNDNGPSSSTELEGWDETRLLISVSGSLMWGANGLTQSAYESARNQLELAAPGQNLARLVESNGTTILAYNFNTTGLSDQSGNGYDASIPSGSSANITSAGLLLPAGSSITTPLTSKGLNHSYTLTLSLSSPFTRLQVAGPDTVLTLQSGQPPVIWATNGFYYPLRNVSTNETVALYLNETTTVVLATNQQEGTGVWVDEEQVGWFGEGLSRYNNDTVFAWVQMAFVAPLGNITALGDGTATVVAWKVEDRYYV